MLNLTHKNCPALPWKMGKQTRTAEDGRERRERKNHSKTLQRRETPKHNISSSISIFKTPTCKRRWNLKSGALILKMHTVIAGQTWICYLTSWHYNFFISKLGIVLRIFKDSIFLSTNPIFDAILLCFVFTREHINKTKN